MGIYLRGETYWARHTFTKGGKEKRWSLDTTFESEATRKFKDAVARASIEQVTARTGLDMSFRDAADAYVSWARRNRKRNTAERYTVSVRMLMRQFEHHRLSDISPSHVAEFVAKRRASKVGSKKPEDGTIRHDIIVLSGIVNLAASTLPLDAPAYVNPTTVYMDRIGDRELKFFEPCTRWLKDAEVTAFMALIGKREKGHRRLYSEGARRIRWFSTLALESGMRLGEIMALQLKEIDRDARRFRLDKRKTKSSRDRVVHISPRALKVLDEMWPAEPFNTPNDWLWTTPDGKRIKSIRQGFEAAVAEFVAAGGEHFTAHDLRRTAGCRWLNDGNSMEAVSQALGHSNVIVTQKHYAFLDAEKRAASMETRSVDREKTSNEDGSAVVDNSELQDQFAQIVRNEPAQTK